MVPPQASKELRQLFEQMKTNTTERKRVYDIIEEVNREITYAEGKKAKAEKKVHPKYSKADQLEKGIKELERRL